MYYHVWCHLIFIINNKLYNVHSKSFRFYCKPIFVVYGMLSYVSYAHYALYMHYASQHV